MRSNHSVKPKKFFGQHFLQDENIAQKIVENIRYTEPANLLEIGPGMGVLTKYLIENQSINLQLIEIDKESVAYLCNNFPALSTKIIQGDFLKLDLNSLFESQHSFSIVGNFPYNISSQILFKVLEYKDRIPYITGMFQKEVAERIASKPGSKAYGIISVLLQAWYSIELLFSVDEYSFHPPPKVKSAVIRLSRNSRNNLECGHENFIRIVKTAFNQRRKTMRNSLKSLLHEKIAQDEIFSLRPEQLSVEEFVEITKKIYQIQ